MLRLLSYLTVILILTSCYKGSSGMLLKRKYNKGYFVQHSKKAESKKINVGETHTKHLANVEEVSTEKADLITATSNAATNAPTLVHKSLAPSPEKTNTPTASKSTSAQINKIKLATQNKSQKNHPNGCFSDPGFNDVTGPLAIVVFILLTIVYAAAIMSQSPGANWIVALALGALFAAITMVTGVSCM